jgi:hypothetical protein
VVPTATPEEPKNPRQYRGRNSARALLKWFEEMRALLKGEHLPRDLSTNHDYYVWEEETQK